MEIFKTRPGQSVSDIAIEIYGTIEAVFTLLEDNPVLNNSLDATPSPGTELKIREVNALSPESSFIQSEVKRNNYKIASAPTSQQQPSGYVDAGYVQLNYVE